jgi:GDPmannose 4,6-dehydratase
VREFVEKAFAHVGRKVVWEGKGQAERGIESGSGRVLLEIDPRYFRPTEAEYLVGDPSKAHRQLGWKHRVTFDALVKEMVDEDLKALRGEAQRRSPHD